jgi:hypothetical protein
MIPRSNSKIGMDKGPNGYDYRRHNMSSQYFELSGTLLGPMRTGGYCLDCTCKTHLIPKDVSHHCEY